MTLQRLDGKSFEEIVFEEEESCLVIFSRPTCHVCESVIPALESIRTQYADKFGFYNVDVEKDRDVFLKFSLKGVPQILFFKDGELHGKISGAADEEQITEKIAQVLET